MITLDRQFVAHHLPHRPDDAHKGTMGTLCSLTGSYGCAGAALLSSTAALKSGVGLHLQVLPESIYPIYASSVAESVCIPVKGSPAGAFCRADLPAIFDAVSRSTAVLVGCGISFTPDTRAVIGELVRRCEVPLIIDADGINALAANIHVLKERRGSVILTPHLKEFSRLTGLSVDVIASRQEELAANFAAEHPGVTLVLKSHRTVIAQDDRLFLNTAGNSGMAKGGSGDVLAGVIASLAAQGVEPLYAAAVGVHVHALAGDDAAERRGKTSMIARDIIGSLTPVYRSFEEWEEIPAEAPQDAEQNPDQNPEQTAEQNTNTEN